MRALSLLAAAAMVVSLFLPWLAIAGASFVPFDLVRQLNPDLQAVQDFVSQAPVEMVAFLATFVLAAVFIVFSVLGVPSRVLALLTGLLAVGIVVYGFMQARDGALQTGLPLPQSNDLSQIFDAVSQVIGLGAWAWGVGALVLLFAGIVGLGRER